MIYRYVGNGDHFPGLPACDITDPDALTEAQKVALVGATALGLYRIEDEVVQSVGQKKRQAKNVEEETASNQIEPTGTGAPDES